MLLTISTQHRPATDLGYLLHEHPARYQSFDLSFGAAHVFFPEASESRCTAALLLDVDPIGITRLQRSSAEEGETLEHFVNDRLYVTSTFMSIAISHIFGDTLSGKCSERPLLVDEPIPLKARLAAVHCRGGKRLLHRLFVPLGYELKVHRHLLDETIPDWGLSDYYTVELEGEFRLREMLSHLCALLPVLDDNKYTWVGDSEIRKLEACGRRWLKTHPEYNEITFRYRRQPQTLSRNALLRLAADDNADPDGVMAKNAASEKRFEESIDLENKRFGRVIEILRHYGVRRIVDLGCGRGGLLMGLLQDRRFEQIIGLDVSQWALSEARTYLRLDELAPRQRSRIELIQGALSYRDRRIEGLDAATVLGVIEHLDPIRLATFERVVFEFARPRLVVVTTPNSGYNVNFRKPLERGVRNLDHRFEWSRQEFKAWAEKVGKRFNYRVEIQGIGPQDEHIGAPTQLGVFVYE